MLAFELRFRAGPARACPIRVGRGILHRLADQLVAESPARSLVVISDSNVAPLYGEPLARRLRGGGCRSHLLVFDAGEAHKTRETKADLEDRLPGLGVGRDTAFLAVGGGVTGDLAGFVAATWHRGVPVIQVPTSLLSMADSALGGKTGVDLPGGKNLVGAFHQPSAIWVDLSTLDTLPETELRYGFSEVVKSAVIADAKLFRWLEGAAADLLGRDADALQSAVERCLRIKGRVVARDERESGRRAVLNFGHTVGHALEAVSGYRISHGRAVSLGMAVEARLAVDATGFPSAHIGRLERLLGAFGLPVRWPEDVPARDVVERTRLDKKSREGRARYALPVAVGKMLPGADVTVEVDEARLPAAIADVTPGPATN